MIQYLLQEQIKKKIVIFGAGRDGLKVFQFLKKAGVYPAFFIDNNKKLWNTDIEGIPICSIDEIKQYNSKDIIIIIASIQYKKEMILQLERNGIKDNIFDEIELYTTKYEDYKPIYFDIDDKSKVSIVMTVFNQWNYTYNCLKSLEKYKNKAKYNVVIGDNASQDHTVYIDDYIKNVKIIHREKNVGYLKNVNLTMKEVNSEYALLIQNDIVFMQDYWLDILLDYIEKDEKCACISPEIVSYDDVYINRGDWIDNKGLVNEITERSIVDSPYDVMYVQPACVLFRKKIWDKLKGYNEEFSPAWCEDEDLYLRIMEMGYKVMVHPKVKYKHYGSITCGQCPTQILNEHLKILLKRWNGKLFDKESQSKEYWGLRT